MSQEADSGSDLDLTPRAQPSINGLQTSEPLNMDGSQKTNEQGTDPDLNPQAQRLSPANIFILDTSEALSLAVHGMANLINTRLRKEAMDLCIELLEAGVNPKELANVISYTLEVKKNTKDDWSTIPSQNFPADEAITLISTDSRPAQP